MSAATRKPLIAGNWKMHNTIDESAALAKALAGGASADAQTLVAPSFTALNAVARAVKGTGILVAAQDCCWEDKGAFTGAVSPAQIKDAGATHVIIGHSERRAIFGDTDGIVNRKIAAALRHGLVPVFCVGETLEERESGKTEKVLETQLEGGLKGFSAAQLSELVIAYEPVWAIGTGKTATPQQAQDAHLFIRGKVSALLGADFAKKVRILYGGSVKPENIDELMDRPDLDGALVGGASLKADGFLRIMNFRRKP
ncbi:MAG: triose-phosphate isomerase [Elusimicrobiales bacterium]